jgi:hypothetical protein
LRDAPQSIGVVQVGQSASSSVMTDSQCEHFSAGVGWASNTASARPAGDIVGVSSIGHFLSNGELVVSNDAPRRAVAHGPEVPICRRSRVTSLGAAMIFDARSFASELIERELAPT